MKSILSFILFSCLFAPLAFGGNPLITLADVETAVMNTPTKASPLSEQYETMRKTMKEADKETLLKNFNQSLEEMKSSWDVFDKQIRDTNQQLDILIDDNLLSDSQLKDLVNSFSSMIGYYGYMLEMLSDILTMHKYRQFSTPEDTVEGTPDVAAENNNSDSNSSSDLSSYIEQKAQQMIDQEIQQNIEYFLDIYKTAMFSLLMMLLVYLANFLYIDFDIIYKGIRNRFDPMCRKGVDLKLYEISEQINNYDKFLLKLKMHYIYSIAVIAVMPPCILWNSLSDASVSAKLLYIFSDWKSFITSIALIIDIFKRIPVGIFYLSTVNLGIASICYGICLYLWNKWNKAWQRLNQQLSANANQPTK